MCTFTTKELAQIHGVSERKFYTLLKIAKKKRQFKKTSYGKGYNEPEARKLAKIFGFVTSLENHLRR